MLNSERLDRGIVRHRRERMTDLINRSRSVGMVRLVMTFARGIKMPVTFGLLNRLHSVSRAVRSDRKNIGRSYSTSRGKASQR